MHLKEQTVKEPVLLDFRTHPDRYLHWKLTLEGPVAYLRMDVNDGGSAFEGYELKLNS